MVFLSKTIVIQGWNPFYLNYTQKHTTTTATATLQIKDTLEIIDVVVFPNPTKPGAGIGISFDVTKQVSEIRVRFYTAAFRRFAEYKSTGSYLRRTIISVPERAISRLSSGSYYVQVEARTATGERAVSGTVVAVILR